MIRNRMIVGFSGHGGLGQQVTAAIEGLAYDWEIMTAEFPNAPIFQIENSGRFARGWPLSPTEAMVVLSEKTRPALAADYRFTRDMGGGELDASFSYLVATPLADAPCLFQFDWRGTPEELKDELRFVSLGKGQDDADPFLAFLRHLYWPTNQPTLADGKLAVLWTLKHSIRVSAKSIAEPIQMAVIERRGGNWGAWELEETELKSLEETMNRAESHFRQFQSAAPVQSATTA